MKFYEDGDLTWQFCQCDTRMIQRDFGFECPKCKMQLRWVSP